MRLVLASRSPRRKELLDAAGIPHQVRVADVDESLRIGEEPASYVRRLAKLKAEAIVAADDEVVLGADTSVVVGDQILGKPLDPDDALRMLRMLSGRRHEVITGIHLRHAGGSVCAHDITGVWVALMTEQQMKAYAASGEPMDKAGAYAIQGIASRYIERIEGSYSNVVGLPVALLCRKLEELGCPLV